MFRYSRRIGLMIVCAAALGLAAPAICLGAGRADAVNKDRGGVALSGYDPVAYFVSSRPLKGARQYAHQALGAVWLFATPENRTLFEANPEKYAPQFGGYCAWAVSQGYTAPIDPQAWKIIDGKLYLNYSKNVQKKWEQDVQQRIAEGAKNWPNLHK